MRPGDTLTVHALQQDATGAPVEPITAYEVVRDLPDPTAPNRTVAARLRAPAQRMARRARIVRRGFDVAHIGNLAYQTDWVDLRRLRRHVALVCDVHDVRPHRQTLPDPVERALLRATYRAGGHLIVLHKVLKEQMIDEFAIASDRIHVVPHVLDASVVADPTRLAPARPRLLVFGTLRANKGLEVLADAVDALGSSLAADVVVAGYGDDDVKDMLVRKLGGRANVVLELGRISPQRKAELFANASWCVLPYVSFHSQSGVLADAYAYRVPLIVSDVGALGPTVRDDGTGIVVAPGDARELAEALLRAIGLPRAAFEAALDQAAHAHDVSVVGPTLRRIYQIAADDR
jgi:glycosyltransferase involved in cell wall biosynthesis